MIDSIRNVFSENFMMSLHSGIGGIIMNVRANSSIMDRDRDDSEFSNSGKYGSYNRGWRDEVDSDTENVILEILYQTPPLYEIEVHQLAYLVDVFTLEKVGEQLLDVRYMPDHHGVYSQDISMTLQILAEDNRISPKADMYESEIVAKYIRVDPVESPDHISDIVDHVLTETEGYSMDDLINKTRNHRARKDTNFGDVIRLNRHKKNVDSNEEDAIFDTSIELNINGIS